MFNRGFTARANRVINVGSQDIAKRFNADRLLPEHLILAILEEKESVAVKNLQMLNVDIDELKLDIEEYLEKREGPVYLGDILPSPEVQRLIELSMIESKNMGYSYVGTEHLFLGAMLLPESIIVHVLEDYNVTVNKFREGIIKIIGFGKNIPKKDTLKKTPTLDEFGKDLTNFARKGKLDKVIGRDAEIERVIQILSRRTKNNPVLIGEPGVGKTAIVEGLAQKIVNNDVPDILLDKRVVALDLALLVAGTKYRGEFEDRLKRLMKEIVEAQNIILFVDELHTVIGAGAAEGAIDASNMLKPALARGELRCIGATTLSEYKKHIEKDTALERRFQPVLIDEPTVEETIKILKGVKFLYEAHHNVTYTDRALEKAAYLSHRYIADRYLPDKAIDLIDEAGSRVKIKNSIKPQELAVIDKELESLEIQKAQYIKEQLFEECEGLKDKINSLKLKREEIYTKWMKKNSNTKAVVDEDCILDVVSTITKIPVSRIVESESQKLLRMEQELKEKIIGQDDAVNAIAAAVRRSRIGLGPKNRPMGSFIFLGPTGVGKTELAKRLAEFLFGDKDALIRIDMSDFMEKHNVSRLVGAPPGYIGYDEGGLLTEKIRRRPYSVVLLDEIEKAHPDVFNLLLQLLEEGQLSDNLGHVVSFRDTIVIMTSNVGARDLSKENSLGFSLSDKEGDYKESKNLLLNELKKFFNPEFLNRVDEIVVFRTLDFADLTKIIDIMFVEVMESVKEHKIHVELSDDAKRFLIENFYDKKYGARSLRRAIQKEIADPLSVEILSKKFEKNSLVNVVVEEDKIKFVGRKIEKNAKKLIKA